MNNYINKDLKELIIALAGIVAFGDALIESGRLHEEDVDAIKLMIGSATTVAQHLLQGRDDEQIAALNRSARYYELIAVPKSSAQIGKEYYIAPKEAFEALIEELTSPCPFCDKEGKAAERCTLRKIFIQCGVTGNTKGDCPFKGV